MQRRSQHVDIEELLCTRWYGVVCWLKIAVLAGHFVSRRTQFNEPCSLPGVFVAQWLAVADVGKGPGPPLFWQKNNNNNSIGKTQKEEKPAGQAIFANQFCFNISKKTPTPLDQGLDPPLVGAFDRR